MNVIDMTTGIHLGHENAFDCFYRLYATRMRRYLLVVARGDQSAADEVHQDTMLRIIRHMKPLPSDDDVWRYVVMCMRSAWIDFLRVKKNAEQHRKQLSIHEGNLYVTHNEEHIDNQLHELLKNSISSLPPDDQQLIQDHYFAGVKQISLAHDQEKNTKAIGMRLVRIRRRLRDFILEGLNNG